MSAEHEAELRVALTEGLVTRTEADALGEEARKLERSPLALLVERGKLTQETLESLQAGARPSDTPLAAATVTVAPGASAQRLQDREVPAFPVKGWDRYEPLRFLGQGGMGMVFLARDAHLHRDVALKFVRVDDARSRQRLIAEARAQARVNHERVCKVYEVGEVSGQVYIAMQYIDGEPLSAFAGRLTVEQKARILRDAALGVHEAHRQGLMGHPGGSRGHYTQVSREGPLGAVRLRARAGRRYPTVPRGDTSRSKNAIQRPCTDARCGTFPQNERGSRRHRARTCVKQKD